MTIGRLGLLGLAVLLGACGTGTDRPAGEVRRVSGEDRELASPAVVYTLGSADGPSWQSFEHLAHVGFDGDDNLFVLDRGAGKVFVYDPNGRFVREIGRPGRGPGELTFPVRLAVTPEGTVVVSDMRRGAFVLFDREGRHLGNLPFPFRGAVGGVEIRPHPGGGFASENQALPGPRGDAGEIRVTWHLPPSPAPRLLASVPADPDRLASVAVGPRETAFLPRFYWGVLPSGGTVVAHTEEYRLDVFTPAGKLGRSIERPIKPHFVTARDREDERQKRLGELTENGTNIPPEIRGAALRELDKLSFARVMPVIEDLTVDPSGRIWVRRGTLPRGGTGRIDLIDGEGTYLGTLRGSRLPVAFSRGGLAAYIQEDSLGVQKVSVSRLPDEWRSPAAGGVRQTAGNLSASPEHPRQP